MVPPKPPRELVSRHLSAARQVGHGPAFIRETFRLQRPDARIKAREWFRRYPKAAYWTQVESWRLLDGDIVEFTMRRLPTAD